MIELTANHHTIPHMGHRFDANLKCICETTWGQHQDAPVPCPVTWCPPPSPELAKLRRLCVYHDVTPARIAQHAHSSAWAARQALNGWPGLTDYVREVSLRSARALLREAGSGSDVAQEPAV